MVSPFALRTHTVGFPRAERLLNQSRQVVVIFSAASVLIVFLLNTTCAEAWPAANVPAIATNSGAREAKGFLMTFSYWWCLFLGGCFRFHHRVETRLRALRVGRTLGPRDSDRAHQFAPALPIRLE